MITIYKYPLKITEHQTVMIPGSSHIGNILKIAWQGNTLNLWAQVDTKQPEQPIEIRVVGTGHIVDEEVETKFHFIETIFQGPYVWHFYVRWRD